MRKAGECTVAAYDFDRTITRSNTGKKTDKDSADPFLNIERARKNIKSGFNPIHDSALNQYFFIATFHRDIRVVHLHLIAIYEIMDCRIEINDDQQIHTNDAGGEFYTRSFILYKKTASGAEIKEPMPIFVAYLPAYDDNMDEYFANQKRVSNKVGMLQTVEGFFKTLGKPPTQLSFFDDKKANVDAVFPVYRHSYLVEHPQDPTQQFIAREIFHNPHTGANEIGTKICDCRGENIYPAHSRDRLFHDSAAKKPSTETKLSEVCAQFS